MIETDLFYFGRNIYLYLKGVNCNIVSLMESPLMPDGETEIGNSPVRDNILAQHLQRTLYC